MSISADAVRHIAQLSRLQIQQAAMPQLQQDLNAVLGLFEQLAAIDVSEIAPLFHPGDPSLRLRIDTVTEIDQRAAFQALATEVSADLYLVPKVLEAALPAAKNP
jgi:aspartyl-tRNA(Asn)/glutamyl-tRNA(Gln) amidotransferase subunit C